MKKTRHQKFVDELHKQLTDAAVHQITLPKSQPYPSDREDSKEDIEREFKNFYNLFGDLDDD